MAAGCRHSPTPAPNARYVCADRELAYWTKRQESAPAACPWVSDSVLPIMAANRADIVKSAHAFNDLVTLIPTPGHSIDHSSVHVGIPGSDAVITASGLLIRNRNRTSCRARDNAPAAGNGSCPLRALFARFCDTPTLMCTAHFPSPCTGRIVRRDAFDIV